MSLSLGEPPPIHLELDLSFGPFCRTVTPVVARQEPENSD